MTERWGLTIPLEGITLPEHRDLLREAEDLGYTDFWSYEAEVDPFVPLALAATATRRATLGTAIVGAFTRGPAIIAVGAVVREEARVVGKNPDDVEVVCRIFVCPTEDPAMARDAFRRTVTAYLNVPVYRKFHEWLGRAEILREMHDRWDRGDRRGALAAVSDRIVDDLCVIGTPDECRAHIRAYCESGVTVPVLKLINLESDLVRRGAESAAMVRALRPA